MKRLFKILVISLVVFVILFIGLDLLISDFGPGETQAGRLKVIAIYLIISFVILYVLKKKLQ
ncbi:MAG: hypothetical protein WD988_01565 [Candidatus Curtissbacteria bacterium]